MFLMPKINQIKKRDGRIAPFEPGKIENAILRAFIANDTGSPETAKNLTRQVTEILERKYAETTPGVETIQDIVEEVLLKNGFASVARSYILYRQQRAELRAAKAMLGVTDDLKLNINAIRVLQRRYLLRDEKGNIIETPSQLFRRVAKAVAFADKLNGEGANVAKTEEEFYEMMVNLEFVPNSPTLMNAGAPLGQLAACFVIPVPDSIEEIFDSLKIMALIHQSGGGTGFSFSRLRPAGDIVKSTKGIASGPVSFIKVFDISTDVIKQGGRRRGANMGVLRVDHPDILEFITSKINESSLANFNISVGLTDKFMEAVEKGTEYDLINPRSGKTERKLNAKEVFDLIVDMAWRTGDPGLLFLDEINRNNPTPHLGQIESTNPCGEVPLMPYESCILGSINLAKMIKDGGIDWEKFRKVVRNSVHFLDNVIEVNKFPVPEIEKMTKMTRKIGLGVMGFAEMLLELGIPYDTEEALAKADEVMRFISEEGRKMSVELGERRGSFPSFHGSLWEKKGYKTMRNATVTTIAPTGTISIIAGTTSGIEPLFAVAYVRNVLSGTQLIEVNETFEKLAIKRGFHSRELMLKLSRLASIKKVEEIPEDVRRVFVTAFDVTPEWHVRMQAMFQKYTDNAVSKTINLPHEATPEDVRRAYMLAYMLRCKGITIYRYGSKSKQVLSISPQSAPSPETKPGQNNNGSV